MTIFFKIEFASISEDKCFIFFFLYSIDRYTLVQTNVNNNKTEVEIIQSQTKNKTSLPYSVHVMRHKI